MPADPSGKTSHAELRKLAEAATPGPWTADRCADWHHPAPHVLTLHPDWAHARQRIIDLRIGDDNQIGDLHCTSGKYEIECQNAAYIAAAHPQAVLALLDEIDVLRGQATKRVSNRRGLHRVHALDERRIQPERRKGFLP